MMAMSTLAQRSILRMKSSDSETTQSIYYQKVTDLQIKVTELDVIMKNSVDDIKELKFAQSEITKKMDDGFSVILEKITTLTCEFSMLRSKHFWYPIFGSLLLQVVGFVAVIMVRK